MTAAKDAIDKVKSTGGTIDLTPYNPTPPEVAVCWSLFPGMMPPPQGNGMMPLPVPLCWSHQLSIQLQDTALAVGGSAMLGAGPGGAYLLGNGK
jgi:hypothetical protein